MVVFGATQENRKNLIFSDLVTSNKMLQDELTSRGLQIEKNAVNIKSLNEKLDNLLKQISTLTANDEKNQIIAYDLNNKSDRISNRESRLRNIEAFLPTEALMRIRI